MLEVHVKQVTVFMTEPRSIIKILNVEKIDHIEKMWLAKLKEIAVDKYYGVVWDNLILISLCFYMLNILSVYLRNVLPTLKVPYSHFQIIIFHPRLQWSSPALVIFKQIL